MREERARPPSGFAGGGPPRLGGFGGPSEPEGRSGPTDLEEERGTELLRLYERAVPEVYGYLLHRCRDAETAEDLTSEVFLAAVAGIKAGKPVPLTMPWLIGVARHKLVDHWRRQSRQERLLAAVGDSVEETADPWDVHLDQVRAAEVMSSLGVHHRMALTLRYLDGLPVAEVAGLLDRTLHGTEALLVRARAAFRRGYTEGGGDDV